SGTRRRPARRTAGRAPEDSTMKDPLSAPGSRKSRRVANVPTLAAPPPEDMAWEDALVTLLSNLELRRARLEDLSNQRPPHAVVDQFIGLVTFLADFAAKSCVGLGSEESLRDLRALADAFLARARELLSNLRPSLGKTLGWLFGRSRPIDVVAESAEV